MFAKAIILFATFEISSDIEPVVSIANTMSACPMGSSDIVATPLSMRAIRSLFKVTMPDELLSLLIPLLSSSGSTNRLVASFGFDTGAIDSGDVVIES